MDDRAEAAVENPASESGWLRSAAQSLIGTLGLCIPAPLRLAFLKKTGRGSSLFRYGSRFELPDYLGQFRVEIDAANMIELSCALGTFEIDLHQSIDALVAPGDVCIDVGANTGLVALALARAAGPTGRVLAFEPGPPYLERLRAKLSRNPSLQGCLEVIGMGAGRAAGDAEWQCDPQHPWNADLSTVHGSRDAGVGSGSDVQVELTTIDAEVQRRDLPRVDVIKVDTEGMELEVLLGAQQTLKKFKPLLMMETLMIFDGPDQARKQLEDFLLEFGYSLYRLDPVERTRVYYPDLPSNALAIHEA